MDEHGFDVRLRHLEHILAGKQSSRLIRTNDTSLIQRLQALRQELQQVYKNNKPIQEFSSKYEAHAKVLNPSESTFSMERDILAPDTRLELVLAASEDLEKFATEVKQIKSLEHVVSGENLQGLEALGQQLAPLEVAHMDQMKDLHQLTREISHVMDNYNGMIQTLSEIFISWDSILTMAESHVSALESKSEHI